MKSLHELPRFQDRWSYLYLERGLLDQEASGLVFHTMDADTPVPIDQLSLVMLGPGISISHAAVKACGSLTCVRSKRPDFSRKRNSRAACPRFQKRST